MKQKIITSTEPNNVVFLQGKSIDVESFPSSEQSSRVRDLVMKKWGIPLHPSNKYVPPEIFLMERLIWIRYRRPNLWWPAILYDNYAEVQQQQQVWEKVDVWSRIRYTSLMALSPRNPKNNMPVARLLGRPLPIELVEVPRSADRSPFYWQLPEILPKAAGDSTYFKDYPELYYDWHRAIDQVEQMLQDFLGKRHAFQKGGGGGRILVQSWYEYAREAERAKWNTQLRVAYSFLCSCCADTDQTYSNEIDPKDSILETNRLPGVTTSSSINTTTVTLNTAVIPKNYKLVSDL